MTDNVLELGTFEETRDGVPLKYKIITIPAEIIEDVIDHMVVNFLPREPFCSHYDVLNDVLALKAIKLIWKKLIEQGASMVAIAERPGPLKDRIIGANITFVANVDDPEIPLDNTGSFKTIYLACYEAHDRAKIFEKYGVDKTLEAFGLSVDKNFHGYHVGERLLQCREPLCRHLGIKVTGTIFTAASSQYLSKKVGFKVLCEEEYSTFSHNGKVLFEGLPGKFEYSALAYD